MYQSFFDELMKIAAASTESEEEPSKVMRGTVAARPWVTSAAKGALPTASLAALLPVNPKVAPGMKQEEIMLKQVAAGKRKSKLIAGAAALGTAAGLADKYMKDWAARHPHAKVTKKLEGQLHREKGEFKKIGAMAGDLRRKGLGGVNEPPFPTEDSKQVAEQQLVNAQKPASFATHTMPRHLVRPGPSINQVATLPR